MFRQPSTVLLDRRIWRRPHFRRRGRDGQVRFRCAPTAITPASTWPRRSTLRRFSPSRFPTRNPRAEIRLSAEAAHPDQARLQEPEMDHGDVRDQPLPRRLLGRPRLQLVRRGLGDDLAYLFPPACPAGPFYYVRLGGLRSSYVGDSIPSIAVRWSRPARPSQRLASETPWKSFFTMLHHLRAGTLRNTHRSRCAVRRSPPKFYKRRAYLT